MENTPYNWNKVVLSISGDEGAISIGLEKSDIEHYKKTTGAELKDLLELMIKTLEQETPPLRISSEDK